MGLTQAQTSHRGLTKELLRDLQEAVSDSSSGSSDQQVLHFTGGKPMDTYLNRMIDLSVGATSKAALDRVDSVQVSILDYSLTLNRNVEESTRNTRYTRQLALSVSFTVGELEFDWQGKITDKLSNTQVRELLDEQFPVKITGNYGAGEPRMITVILTTLSIFSLVTVLFFIRT